MNFPYVLSDEILLRAKYEKKMEQNYVLSDCPSLYIYIEYMEYMEESSDIIREVWNV